MARLMTRLADLCRHRAAEERFLRRFCMMRDADGDERGGPGWYDSSRELERGLLVREGDPGGALYALWLDAQRSRAIASPSSITASA